MNKQGDFFDWWHRQKGYEKWRDALDAEGGTLKALEMVFNAGMAAERSKSEELSND